jgi:hypothetical protein
MLSMHPRSGWFGRLLCGLAAIVCAFAHAQVPARAEYVAFGDVGEIRLCTAQVSSFLGGHAQQRCETAAPVFLRSLLGQASVQHRCPAGTQLLGVSQIRCASVPHRSLSGAISSNFSGQLCCGAARPVQPPAVAALPSSLSHTEVSPPSVVVIVAAETQAPPPAHHVPTHSWPHDLARPTHTMNMVLAIAGRPTTGAGTDAGYLCPPSGLLIARERFYEYALLSDEMPDMDRVCRAKARSASASHALSAKVQRCNPVAATQAVSAHAEVLCGERARLRPPH